LFNRWAKTLRAFSAGGWCGCGCCADEDEDVCIDEEVGVVDEVGNGIVMVLSKWFGCCCYFFLG
jgi:hypothetical protein